MQMSRLYEAMVNLSSKKESATYNKHDLHYKKFQKPIVKKMMQLALF